MTVRTSGRMGEEVDEAQEQGQGPPIPRVIPPS